MSKRAEEAAAKRYPEIRHFFDSAFGRMTYDENHQKREGFIQGYEQAEKDTIERAISWLIEHVDDYIVDMEVSRYKPSKMYVGGMCWERLKKAMEEE